MGSSYLRPKAYGLGRPQRTAGRTKLKLPTQLKIGGHTYKIQLIEESLLEDNETCGRIDRSKGLILIGKNLMQSEKEVTLFHEIIHGINGELKEELVDSLAQGIYQVLSDNKMLK